MERLRLRARCLAQQRRGPWRAGCGKERAFNGGHNQTEGGSRSSTSEREHSCLALERNYSNYQLREPKETIRRYSGVRFSVKYSFILPSTAVAVWPRGCAGGVVTYVVCSSRQLKTARICSTQRMLNPRDVVFCVPKAFVLPSYWYILSGMRRLVYSGSNKYVFAIERSLFYNVSGVIFVVLGCCTKNVSAGSPICPTAFRRFTVPSKVKYFRGALLQYHICALKAVASAENSN